MIRISRIKRKRKQSNRRDSNNQIFSVRNFSMSLIKNFAKMQSFCRVLGELPETLQKLCYSTKFSRQKTLRNLSILLSEYSSSFLSLSRYIWLSLSRKLITDFNLSVFTYHDCHYFLDTLFRQVFCNIPKCKVVTPNVNVTPKCFDK